MNTKEIKRVRAKSSITGTLFISVLILSGLLIICTGSAAATAALTATRDISDQTVTVGDTFTVTVTVTGNHDATTPTLDEDLPSGWTVTVLDSDGATYKSSTTEWVWLSLTADATKTVIYNVTVPSDATADDYTITGTVSAFGVTATAVGGASTVTVSEPVDALTATRDISATSVAASESFTVTVDIAANQDVTALTLDEDLPSGWTVTEVSSDGATFTSATAEWLWSGSVSSGTTKTVIYSVAVPATATTGSYTITGAVSATGVTAISVGGESAITVSAEGISATRDISATTVATGGSFTVTVALTANEAVTALTLDEDLPSGWTVTEVDSAGATYKSSSTEWLWMGSLSAGASKTVIYSVAVPSDATAGDYTITGTVSAFGISATAVGGESTVTVSTSGSVLTTITISPSTANVTAGIPQQFTATAYDQYGDAMAGASITWTSSNLSIGTVSPATATTDSNGNASTNLTGIIEGTVTVMAASGTVNASATVTVEWNPWDDDGVITTAEIQEALNCWLTDTPKNGHNITTAEIQELVNMWLAG